MDLPPFEQAQATIAQMQNQIILEKCAAAGFAPRNEAEAQQILKLAYDVDAAERAGHIKHAEDNSFYASAHQGLQSVLGQVKSAAPYDAQVRQQQLHQLASNSAIYNSILAIKSAEAEYAGQVLQQQLAAAQPAK